jgi:phosphatidylethanolamine-binding protein (PEBP) family uncharacterized protein
MPLAWDILPETIIQEDSVPGIQGRNSMGANKYMVLPSSGIHQYHFKVYALDIKLNTLPKYQRKEIDGSNDPILSAQENF